MTVIVALLVLGVVLSYMTKMNIIYTNFNSYNLYEFWPYKRGQLPILYQGQMELVTPQLLMVEMLFLIKVQYMTERTGLKLSLASCTPA